MLYLSCPTCGYFLGNKTMEYETKKDLICSNPKYDKNKQGEEIQKLLKSLKLRRYCCRMRMMTYKDIVHEIIPLPNE
jgi:DNA-directed RNA polymerase subunit N (RpoN/RPB10)